MRRGGEGVRNLPISKGDKAAAKRVLQGARTAIENRNYGFARARKNIRTLEYFGWIDRDMLEIISSLSYSDYYQGPLHDRNIASSPDLWVFFANRASVRIYIKFSLDYGVEDPPRIFIQSFHVSDEDMARLEEGEAF